MATTNIHLLQFKIQSHLQKRGLYMPVHQNSFIMKLSDVFKMVHSSPKNAKIFCQTQVLLTTYTQQLTTHSCVLKATVSFGLILIGYAMLDSTFNLVTRARLP